MHSYADDANIIISGNNVYKIKNKVNLLTELLIKWVNANSPLINLKKTNCMLFSGENAPVIINFVNTRESKQQRFWA